MVATADEIYLKQVQQEKVEYAKQNLKFNILGSIILIILIICLNVFAFNPNYKDSDWYIVLSIIVNLILGGWLLSNVIYAYRFYMPCIQSNGKDCYEPRGKHRR